MSTNESTTKVLGMPESNSARPPKGRAKKQAPIPESPSAIEVTEEDMLKALSEAIQAEASQPAQKPAKKASKGKKQAESAALPTEASQTTEEPAKSQKTGSTAEEKQARAEAQKMHKACQAIEKILHVMTPMYQNLTAVQHKANGQSSRLNEEQQQACNFAALPGLVDTGKTALESAAKARKTALAAQNSTEANEARKQATEAKTALNEAYTQAGKIGNAIDRAVQKINKQAQAEALKAQKQAEKKQQQLNKANEALEQFNQAYALLAGESEYQGNKIVDVPLNQAHADMLNLIADGLWAEYDPAGQIVIIPAELTLTNKQQALMKQVIEMGYAALQGNGYILTEAGLTLFETTIEEVQQNFAGMLAKAS